MASRLGILVNSNRHPEYVVELSRAARIRGREVCVHFTGAGLKLAGGPLLEALQGLARISCQENDSNMTKAMDLPCLSLCEFFRLCDRTVVF